MKRLGMFFVATSAALGILAGLLTPKLAAAVTAYDLYIQPGGASSYMTCGWHGKPGCPNPGEHLALDWSSAYGAGVWWRSYGVKVPSGGLGMAYPYNASDNPGCTRIGVNVYSPTWVWRGLVVYGHAGLTNSASFAIAGGSPTSPAFTSQFLGNTVVETPPCPWGAQHLHQYNGASGYGNAWYHNTGVYPPAVNPGNYDPYNWSFWQARTSWYD